MRVSLAAPAAASAESEPDELGEGQKPQQPVVASTPGWTNKQAKLVFQHMGLNVIALMTVFTQRIDLYSGLKHFGGDVTKVALRMGMLTAIGSVLEMVANPFMGKLSDTIGRKPLMIVSPISSIILKLLVFLHPSQLTLDVEKLVGTTLSVVGGTTMANACLADLYHSDASQQGLALMNLAMYAAMGIIAGPVIGVGFSKAMGAPRAAFLAGAAISVVHLMTIAGMEDTLPVNLRRPFDARGANPFSFLKLLGEKRQMITLSILGGVMQNIPEGKNLADIHQTFCRSDVGMSDMARGAFVSFFGFSQVVGVVLGKKLTSCIGGRSFTTLAHCSISAAMLWYSTVPVKLRTSWPMFVGAVLQLFVTSSTGYTKAVATEYAQAAKWGMGEFQGALANLRALTSSIIPLVVAAVYSWSKRGGRNRPGLAYQLVAVLSLVTEIMFRTLSSNDLALKQ